jgi:hypothetical protein
MNDMAGEGKLLVSPTEKISWEGGVDSEWLIVRRKMFCSSAHAIGQMPYALFFGRETTDASRTTYKEDGLIQHPAKMQSEDG